MSQEYTFPLPPPLRACHDMDMDMDMDMDVVMDHGHGDGWQLALFLTRQNWYFAKAINFLYCRYINHIGLQSQFITFLQKNLCLRIVFYLHTGFSVASLPARYAFRFSFFLQ